MENHHNIGGLMLNIQATGINETLENIDSLIKKLDEANQLINQITSSQVKLQINSLFQESEG